MSLGKVLVFGDWTTEPTSSLKRYKDAIFAFFKENEEI